jgi:hypothetical protein
MTRSRTVAGAIAVLFSTFWYCLLVAQAQVPGSAPTSKRASAPASGPAGKPAVNSAALAPNNLVIPAGHVSMQTRIFVPNKPPYDKDTWAETAMGQIVAPLVTEFPDLKWFWFSRYLQSADDSGDTEIGKIPKEFFIEIAQPKLTVHRSLRLRFCIPATKLGEFEGMGEKLIKAQGCAISDWRDWDLTADLGSDRTIGENVTPERRAARAGISARFYHATSQLALHCLVGPDKDGYFRFEKNANQQNPLGSSFETPHHVFCNITEVPLSVLVNSDDKQIYIGTFYQPPGGNKRPELVRVRY